MLRRILLAGLAVTSASVLGLVVAEACVRLLGLASPPVAVSVDERTFAELPGIFFPSPQRVDRRIPALPHQVTINDLGFRGAPITLVKANGEFRIAVIGDSFVWGDYVDDDETLPAQLERALRVSCPGVRVMNFGIGGTTIDGQSVMLERSRQLSPDAVLLVFHDNDIEDLRAPTYWTSLAENRARKSRFPASLAYGVLRNTALWGLARQAKAHLDAPRASVPTNNTAATPPLPGDLEILQQRYGEALRAFAQRASELNMPLFVTAYPSHHALRDSAATAFSWFERQVRGDSLDYVSIRHALLASGATVDDLYLLPLDGHASPRGYSIAAQAMAEAIMQSLAIPRCSTAAR